MMFGCEKLDSFGSLHTIAESRHWFGIKAMSTVHCKVGAAKFCRSFGFHSLAAQSSCKRNGRKGKLQEKRGLVPLHPYPRKKCPFFLGEQPC